ncbi:undecaprenyl/decaprenyl-phosphate alpha-N-acetylglucosaminyl 1-phosphate transferase [Streptosporangium sp. NPDC023615]|uniref:glycosyltransferase family 4 protein n=1 Tax=Streptosporangium sp. NPDC023615 TaxID=3154794 RepID=UPI00342F9358
MREYLLMALVAAAVTYLLVPLVRVFAIRIGAMPEVRDRDVHTTPTPRLGGLAMYGGLVAGLLIAVELPYSGGNLAAVGQGNTAIALIAAGGLITLTGFLDDWLGMDALVKLAGQIGAAGVLVAFGVTLPWLPFPSSMGGIIVLDSTLSPIITILIVVVIINAVNFVDGLDGLAAGIIGIAAMATWTYSVQLSKEFGATSINVTALIASVLIGVCLGFLPHNFHPAKIFMGDTGAMLIGLVLASTMITVTQLDSTDINNFPVILPLLVPVAILVLPLMDLIMAVVRRTSNGLSPFSPDRGHLHHRLLDFGHSHRRSVLIMYAWTFLFAFAVVGLSIEGVPLIVFPLIVLLAVGVLVLMALPRLRARRDTGGAGGPGGRGPLRPAGPTGPTGPAGPVGPADGPGRHARPVSPSGPPAPAVPQAPAPSSGPPVQARPHPYPSQPPGPRSVAGDDTTPLGVLPDLSLTAPRQVFSNPETPL